MDPADCSAENSVPTPRFRVLPRFHSPDDEAPPFFVQFARDGKSLELLTPVSRESYSAVPGPAAG